MIAKKRQVAPISRIEDILGKPGNICHDPARMEFNAFCFLPNKEGKYTVLPYYDVDGSFKGLTFEDLACLHRTALSRINALTTLLARVHDELNDPMGFKWCDRPSSDCELLENLRDDVAREMGWDE